MTAPEVLLLGAGGHGVVVLALARALGWQVAGVCDPALPPAPRGRGCRSWTRTPPFQPATRARRSF